MTSRRSDGTALLCVLVFCITCGVGAFGPLLPEIGKTHALSDWQLGILAGSFGLARMIADVPSGVLAGRYLAPTLMVSPAVVLAGLVLLATGGPFPILVLGRILTGLGHTFGMVGGLTAILRDDFGPRASIRLNVFEFAGMLGVLGGLASVGAMPAGWSWPRSLLAASVPVLVPVAIVPMMRHRFFALSGRPSDAPSAPRTSSARTSPIVWLMFGVGIILALAWASVSQFLIPLRGTREFGLDRGGVSSLLALSQLVDLAALLPVGWLADRAGRVPVLGSVVAIVAFGVWGTGLGSFGYFVAGCGLLGLGMAGWMLPLGIIREHIEPHTLAWRTGLYRVGIDGAAFLGPLICGAIGESHTTVFIALVGLAALVAGGCVLWRGRA
ncbi:MAG TPA: MFS transporter [Candidatus Methylomirabilis sp.]|nr:MFS transporter [Candidatus Methylomirabilis sp.]